MSNMLGTPGPNGFLPGTPTLEDLLNGVGLKSFKPVNEQSGNEHMKESPAQKKNKELLQAYARFYNSADGKLILDDVLDVSLRCSPAFPGGMPTLEQCTVYALRRDGQNGLATYILSRIQSGLNATNSEPGSGAAAARKPSRTRKK